MRTALVAVLLTILPLPILAADGEPAINAGGVVNAADYTPSFAPGIIFSIFGSNLSPAIAVATSVPLPETLEGVSVEVVHGAQVYTAPLFFVSAGQINAQLPFGLEGAQVLIRVRNADGVSNEEPISVSAAAPRLFTRTMDGLGEAILVHGDYTPVTAENPARAGEWVVLYLTGLGAVDPPVSAGAAGGADPLNWVRGAAEVTIDGNPATVYFAGLAPTFVGLYQINFQIPENAAAGMAELTVSLGGEPSQEAIRFGCSVTYAEANSAQIGPGGGTVAGGGIQAELPPGGLASSTPITVYEVTGGTQISTDSADPVWAVGGIPENYEGSVKVTVDVPGDPPQPGNGALMMVTESGAGGESVLDTEISGSQASATLEIPAGQAAPALARAPNGRRAASVLDTANAGLQLWQYVRNIQSATSPSGHFLVHYKTDMFRREWANETAEAFDFAEQTLLGMGFSWPAGIDFPVAVNMASGDPGTFIRSGDGVKLNSATGRRTLRINGVGGSAALASVKRTKRIPALSYLLQNYIDTEFRFDSQAVSTPWMWWYVAAGASMRRHYLRSIDSQINPWSYTGGTYEADFLFRHPLQYPAQNTPSAGPSADALGSHGVGAALFVDHLIDRRGSTNWLPGVYGAWTASNSPVEALEAAGFDVSQEWLEFCRAMSLGEFDFGAGPKSANHNSAHAMTRHSLKNRVHLTSKESFPSPHSWNAPDLSAHVVRYELGYAFEEDQKLVLSLPQGGPETVARIFQDTDNSGSDAPQFLGELGPGQSMIIENPGGYTGSALVVMLVNARARKPYNGSTPVQFLVELQENEESEVLTWLKECKRFHVRLAALEPQCQYPSSGDDASCGFGAMLFENVDSFGAQLVPLEWNGRTFTYQGTIYYPGSVNDTVEINGTATVSEDGLSVLSGQFYKKDIGTQSETMVIKEMQIGALQYSGFFAPRKSNKSYSYKAEGPAAVGEALEILKYNEYYKGDVYKTMTGYGFAENTQLEMTFWKE